MALPKEKLAARPKKSEALAPMIILHIIVNLSAGGAELMLKRLVLSHQDNPDYVHHVVSLRGLSTVGPQLQQIGVRVEALGWESPLGFWSAYQRLKQKICALKPDIVQTWMYHSDLVGGLAARTSGHRRILWGVRIADIGVEMGVSRATGWIRRACARLSRSVPARIVYVAESARKVHERLGYDPSKSIVIPNGYTLPPGAPNAAAAALRAGLALPADTILIGSAGRFNAQKDHRGFVAAAKRVADSDPRARFVMMGRGVDRDNAELTAWVAATGHEDRFHLLGERRDIADWLAALDIFCLHSIGEGFPNVVAEAMGAGVPCVVTDVGDAALIVEDEGLVVPPSDPEGLAKAICSLAALEPNARARLGEKGRDSIAARFSMDVIRRRYEQLYRDLVDDLDS